MGAVEHVSLPLFACFPLGVKLTRTSCAARHRRAKRELAHESRKGQAHQVGNARCAECEVGMAHARDEEPASWPDGRPLELCTVAAVGPGTPQGPRPPARPVVVEESRPVRSVEPRRAATILPPPPAETEADVKGKPQTITHEGQTLTYEEWGTRLGLTGQAIRNRIDKGWPIAKALSTGRTGAGGTGRSERERRPAQPRRPQMPAGDPIAAAVATLEEERAALASKLENIDAALAALRPLAEARS